MNINRYINSIHIIHMTEGKLVHTYNKICNLHPQFKRSIEPATKELIKKTQLSPKIISMSSYRFNSFDKKI